MNKLFLAALLLPSALASPSILNKRATCGLKGYNLGTNAYSFLDNSALASFEGCSSKCYESSRCKSFAYGGGACLLFSKKV